MVRINNQIERKQVLEPCLLLCRKLKIAGHILKWRRLDALDYYHESGDPDIEIWFQRKGHVWILMAECKRPIGGKLSPSQIKCRNKYKKFNNVIYIEVKSVQQLEQMIMSFSDYKQEELDEFMKDSI